VAAKIDSISYFYTIAYRTDTVAFKIPNPTTNTNSKTMEEKKEEESGEVSAEKTYEMSQRFLEPGDNNRCVSLRGCWFLCAGCDCVKCEM